MIRFIILIVMNTMLLSAHELDVIVKLMPRIIAHSSNTNTLREIDIGVVHSHSSKHFAYELKNNSKNININCLDILNENFSLEGYKSAYVFEMQKNDLKLFLKEARKNRVIIPIPIKN